MEGEQIGWTRERFDGYPCTPAEARDQRQSLLVDWLRRSNAPAQSFCDLGLFLPHPGVETAEYSVDITYPDAPGEERTMSVFTFCTSDDQTATCEQ